MKTQQEIDDFIFQIEIQAKSLDKDEAFSVISDEISRCDDKQINEYIVAFNFIRHKKTLNWIEMNIHRATNINVNWGHLAASSYFNWDRADKWLTAGRPLSLVALDALIFCTTTGKRLNQSPMMRQIQPKLIDDPKPEIVAKRLREYLLTDSVPRTKNSIHTIIKNIFEI
jgi:hypothetical protein